MRPDRELYNRSSKPMHMPQRLHRSDRSTVDSRLLKKSKLWVWHHHPQAGRPIAAVNTVWKPMSHAIRPADNRRRWNRCLRAAVCSLAFVAPVVGQSSKTGDSATMPASPVEDLPTDIPAHLKPSWDGMLALDARPIERRRYARTLLLDPTEQGRPLVAALLALRSRPDLQVIVCDVIAACARDAQTDQWQDSRFVTPLIKLLGHSDTELRSSAREALAHFPDETVAEQLVAIALDPQAAVGDRVGAVDVLGDHVHRRHVVEQLITLLECGVPDIVRHVTEALAPASRKNYGDDVDKWRSWWARMSKLDENGWLRDRVDLLRVQRRDAQEAYAIERQRRKAEDALRVERIDRLQRDFFRAQPKTQGETKLAEWLSDPLEEVARTALSIIGSLIAEEGYRPTGEVLAALLGLLDSASATIRRETLELAQILSDPAAVAAVLARLGDERDPIVRIAIVRALGKLNDPIAFDALVDAIGPDRSDAATEFVREAARAIGQIAAKLPRGRDLTRAVAALNSRFADARTDDATLRGDLLFAMAGVADLAFTETFRAAINESDGAIPRAALRGLMALDDPTMLARVRDLTRHQDPALRLNAVEAVGRWGAGDADLEPLLTILTAEGETDSALHGAAWDGFRRILRGRSVADRVEKSQSLRDVPELELLYLTELEGSLANGNGRGPDARLVRERIVEVLTRDGKYEEALPRIEQLFERHHDPDDAKSLDTGVELLRIALLTGKYDRIKGVLERLAPLAADARRTARVVATVRLHMDSEAFGEDPANAVALHEQLAPIPADQWGDGWAELMGRLAPVAATAHDDPPPEPPSPRDDPADNSGGDPDSS